MHQIVAAVGLEEAAGESSNWMPAWGIGLGAFAVLGILLVVTWMLNTDR